MKQRIFFLWRIAAASIFIASGLTKLMEPPQNFLAVVYSYKILTGSVARIFAFSVPWAELILGAFLLVGLWTRRAALFLWLLNSLFILAIAQALVRRLPVTDCGCFGNSAASLPLSKVLWLDILLWAGLALLYFFPSLSSSFSLDRRLD